MASYALVFDTYMSTFSACALQDQSGAEGSQACFLHPNNLDSMTAIHELHLAPNVWDNISVTHFEVQLHELR